jgi:hypothetical protein
VQELAAHDTGQLNQAILAMAKAIKDHFDKARAIINSSGKALAVSKVGTDIKLTGCNSFF